MRGVIESFSPEKAALENILAAMEGFTFSKTVSARIVGGEKKLENLIAQGKIEAVKCNNVQNGKWQCNAAQVLRHCRNFRNSKQSGIMSKAREGHNTRVEHAFECP